MYMYNCEIFRLLSNTSLRTSTFRQNAEYADTGSPSGHDGRGLSSIRALELAWQALKVFFSAGSVGADFLGFSV